MKITIYELLGLVKDGKAPKKIKMGDYIYEYRGDDYMCELNDKEYWLFSDGYTKFNEWLENFLNSEVEILEEEKKIPEKIKSNGKEFYCDNIDSWIDKEKTSAYCEYLMNKYNDLIDYLKNKGDE